VSEAIITTALAEGVWRLTSFARGGVLSVNCYLIKESTGFIAVDAGPANQASALLAAITSITPLRTIERIVVLDDTPFAASGLIAWRNGGFSGEIVADWRSALGIAAADVAGPYRYVHQEHDSITYEGSSVLEFRIFPGNPGYLFAYHCRSGCLFTGIIGSSMGRDLPVISEAPGRSNRSFFEAFGRPGPALEEVMSGFAKAPVLICPRSGSCLKAGSIPGSGDWTSTVVSDAGTAEASGEVVSLLDEIDRLRTDNIDLRSSMVVASDAALRDEVSGLYGRSYADEFLLSLIKQDSHFCSVFIMVDRLKELNREAGFASGDRMVADVAGFLLEHSFGGFMFRWSGPVFLLVLESGREESFALTEGIRTALEAERRFSRPVTVSIAIVGSDELHGDDSEQRMSSLQSFSRARLKLLERRGGNEVLYQSSADLRDADLREKTMALVMDGDSISTDYIVEFLNHREFSAIGTARGGEALELMEQYKPEVVIADAYLPQFDAFQIRARMLASPDLNRVPFVLIVESKTDALVERAHTLKIFHIFEKPVPLLELLGVIRYLVGHGVDVD